MIVKPDAARSHNMAAVKGKDTKPEWLVRRMLHAAGFRYRLHVKGLPGRPDLVFPARRAVMIDPAVDISRRPARQRRCRNTIL